MQKTTLDTFAVRHPSNDSVSLIYNVEKLGQLFDTKPDPIPRSDGSERRHNEPYHGENGF